jgi:hypothetical protein
MASNDLLPNKQLCWNPRPRRSIRLKRRRERMLSWLIIGAQTMVGGELHDEET